MIFFFREPMVGENRQEAYDELSQELRIEAVMP